MTNFWQDPELNRLVTELNSDSNRELTEEGKGRNAEDQVEPAEGSSILLPLLADMLRQNASDLHLSVGAPPALRVAGEIRFSDSQALQEDDLRAFFRGVLGTRRKELEREGATDFSFRASIPGRQDSASSARFRVNLHRQRGTLSASIRLLPSEIPTLQQLNLPAALSSLTTPKSGLVLVCGPTGSGKSSTLAALIGEINRRSARHVITIEDPIEYEHKNSRSLIDQIEIGKDSPDFGSALRAALRQDPDVILIGEMRDLETVSIALTAAETGHLIFATVHTSTPEQAINRIVDVFPGSQQSQVFKQIALSLHAILCQKLIRSTDEKRVVPAVELLIASYAVRNQIRKMKLEQLQNEITMGKQQGMISLEDSLAELVRSGQLPIDRAAEHSNQPEELRRMV